MTKAIGTTLIVLGVLALAWGGFSYTTLEKLVDIGPVHATTEKTHNIPITPIAGTLILIAGVAVFAVGRRA